MPIIGADLSKFDPDSAAREYPYVILNVEDPRMANKALIARDAGVTVMLYSWVYPGDGGRSLTRSYAAEELLRLEGVHVVFHWLDYEQAGVRQGDLDDAAARRSAAYAPSGLYTYLNTLESQRPHYPGPLWLAYYPEGYQTVPYYSQMSDTARRYGAVLHQWTSVAPPDGRDHNTVLDLAWYASLGSPTYVPPTPGTTSPKGVDMLYKTTDNGVPTFFREARGYLVPLADPAPWYSAVVAGQIPVIDLGGPLGALAFNEASKAAFKKIGVPV